MRSVALILVLFSLAAQAPLLPAQEKPPPPLPMWENLKKVPFGDNLIVKLRNGKKIRGELVGVSNTSLTLAHQNQVTDFCRTEVGQIYRLVSRSGPNLGVVGLVAGFGLGALAAAFAGKAQGCCTPAYVVFIGGPMAAVGAVTGSAIGARRARVLIYDAQTAQALSELLD